MHCGCEAGVALRVSFIVKGVSVAQKLVVGLSQMRYCEKNKNKVVVIPLRGSLGMRACAWVFLHPCCLRVQKV